MSSDAIGHEFNFNESALCIIVFYSFFFKSYSFILKILAARGHHCCSWDFSSFGEWSYPLVAMLGFSLWWLLLRFRDSRAQVCVFIYLTVSVLVVS